MSLPAISARRLGVDLQSQLRCGRQVLRRGVGQRGFCVANFAVVWVQSGSLRLEYDGVEYSVEAGQAFHRFPDRIHHVSIIDDTQTLFVAIPAGYYSALQQLEVPGVNNIVITPGLCPDIADRWQPLICELQTQSPLRLADTAGRMHALVVDLHLRACIHSQPDAALIERACVLLDQSDAWSVSAVAAEVGMAPSTFRRRFTAVVGQAPWAWRVRRRIDRACDLLQISVMKISDLAEMLGFPDAATFSRSFRAVVGVSPRQWRMQAKDRGDMDCGL